MQLRSSFQRYRFSVCTVFVLSLGVYAAWAVGFPDASVSVSEAAMSVVLIVERQSENMEAFTVDYATADRTATAGQDYVATSGTVEFVEGQLIQEVEILLLNDALVDSSEWFPVQLSNVTGGFELGISTMRVIIVDNDLGVGFAPGAYSVPEDGGRVQLMVQRQTDDQAAFQVDYVTLPQEAQEGSDYVSGSGTLQFAEGEQAQVIEIEILNDGQREQRETFWVALRNAVGLRIAYNKVNVEIEDNDPGIHFDRDYLRVSEGEPLVELTVWRGSDDLGPFTVEYASASRVPPEGGDYEPVSGTLSFAQGVLSQTIEVSLSGDDSAWEGDEEFEVMLSNPSGDRYLATQSAVVVLVDDEPFVWEVVPTGEPLPQGRLWGGVTWGARRYVAVGDQWTAVSRDGKHWTGDQDPDRYGLADVVWGDGEFVAVGDSGVWRSLEGKQWERMTDGPQQELRWVRYGEGTYVVADREGNVWNTADLNNWAFQKFDSDLRGLVHGIEGFVLTGRPGKVWRLRSGTSAWQSLGSITDGDLGAVGWGESGYVTVANRYEEEVITEVLHSFDGVTWEASRLKNVSGFHAYVIEAHGEEYMASGGEGMLRLTYSAGQWTGETSSYPVAEGLAYGGGGYVAANWQGLYSSEDGLLWQKLGAVPLKYVVKVGEEFFATAIVGRGFHSLLMEVRRTQDWVNWVTEMNFVWGGGWGWNLVAQAGKLVMLDQGTLHTRQETGQWTDLLLPDETSLYGLAAGSGHWVAVGTRNDQTTGRRSAISYSSTDSVEWVRTDLGFEGDLGRVEHAGEWFFAQGYDSTQGKPVSLQSREGHEWQSVSWVSWEEDCELEWVTYGKGRYLANVLWDRLQDERLLLSSLNGVDWVPVDWVPTVIDGDQVPNLSLAEYGAGVFVGIGDGIQLSKDGLNWLRCSVPFQAGGRPLGLGYADGRFYIGFGDGEMYPTENGFVLISPPLSYLGHPQGTLDGVLQVLAEGAPGHAYSLEVSEDLVDWESLGPISITSPQESVTLPRGDSGTGRRFYRWGTSSQE